MIVLAGDVGGTKTLLALAVAEPDRLQIIREKRYPSAQYRDLSAIVLDFLDPTGERPDSASFAVAGPVVDDACRAVNLPWQIQCRALAEAIGVPATRILNDFHAVGLGISHLAPADTETLQDGLPVDHGPIGLIGAGTGLGESYLLWEKDHYIVHATEGGHADFAPRNEIEDGLLQFLRARYGHVSYERVLAGPGLVNIYRYLVETRRARTSETVQDRMRTEDPGAVITTLAAGGADEACSQALNIFVSIYGAEAGNLALKTLAAGGVYLAGGIAPRIIDKLQDGTFLSSFHDKGRHRTLMEGIPVRVILNPRVGLYGAIAHAAGHA